MMNADAFRQYYEYHFFANHMIWHYVAQLSDEQYLAASEYSQGSVRDQFAHLLSVDDNWFSGLRGVEFSQPLDDATLADRAALRAYGDAVEGRMRGYLESLRDDMLFERPWTEGEDKDLILWQVLLHVVNHGTDHRAQILRALHDFGISTPPQDYVFYLYGDLQG